MPARASENKCARLKPVPKIITHGNLEKLIQINVALAVSRVR
jgi:hypothetical protein